MPRPKGKFTKKAAIVSEELDIKDAAAVVEINGLKEEVGEALPTKSDALVNGDVDDEEDEAAVEEVEEAPVKTTNGRGGGRGGGRGKKAATTEKKKVTAPRGKGKGKVLEEEVEVTAKEDGESNEDTIEPVEDVKPEVVVTKGKREPAGRGKRGGKKASAPIENLPDEKIEIKENGDAESVQDVPLKAKGRGGKRAAKVKVDDQKIEDALENETAEITKKAPAKRAGGRKKTKPDERAVSEDANEKETDIDDESLKENDTDAAAAAVQEEVKVNTKKSGGRKKKIDESVSEEAKDGKSLFDLLKEEHDAVKDKQEIPNVESVEEENTEENQETDAKPSTKKTARRKKEPPTETDNDSNLNGKTEEFEVTQENTNEEPAKKKGRGGQRKAAAAVAPVKAEEEEVVEKKPTTKRGAAKASKADDNVEEAQKKPIKRGRGAAAKAVTTSEEVPDTAAGAEETVPKKRSRKEPSVEKEIKPEVEKVKNARGGKRKAPAEKIEEDIVECDDTKSDSTQSEEIEGPSAAKKLVKASTAGGSRGGGRKRAAPSANKIKSESIDEENAEKDVATVETPNAEEDDEVDGVDGSKTPKAKKKKKETATAGPMNSTSTTYNKEDFQLPPLGEGQTADEPRYNLKISSWNVAGLRAWLKKEGLKFLEYEEPDIFCMQETKCVTDQLPDEVQRIPGYHPYWLCMPGGYAGVAIYSKIMPINVEYGIGHKEFDDVGRVITAEYEKFFLINVYVPNSGRKLVNLEQRMKWEQLFQEFVQKYNDRKPVVVCGDMNVSHQEIDLANPKTNTRNAGFTKEEREKMSDFLASGYVDTFRHLYPDRKGAYTFWTYMGNARARNVGWRLDYFIVSERFTKKVVDNCIRSQCMGSDHCPITLFLKL